MGEKKDRAKDKETDEGTEVAMSNTWRPDHEVAKSMLWDNPYNYVIALATMYGERHTIVPPKEIPDMIRAFRWAKNKVMEDIDHTITILEEQLREAIQKGKETKEKG